jgi:hypothetical protein
MDSLPRDYGAGAALRQDGVRRAALPVPGIRRGWHRRGFEDLRRPAGNTMSILVCSPITLEWQSRHNSAAIGVQTQGLLEHFVMRFIRSLRRHILGAATVAVFGFVLSTSAVRADWHGSGGHGGGGGWHGGGAGGGGFHGGAGWHGGGGWGWHGGAWGCCWRGGVFIGVPPLFIPPPIYYPPPPVYYPPPAYYPPPYGYAVPGY